MMDLLGRAGLGPLTPAGDQPAGVPALMAASRAGQLHAIEKLLGAGISPDAADANGMTALMWAAEQGIAASVQLLLRRGADPTLRDPGGRTAAAFRSFQEGTTLQAAIRRMLGGAIASSPSAQPDTAKPPRNPWLRELAVRSAAESGRVNQLRAVLDTGVDANLTGADGWPLIAVAAARGYREVVETLLEHGADPDRRGPGDWTALMQASGGGHDQVAELLVSRGADPLAENAWGQTAYNIARDRGHSGVIGLLEQRGGAPGERPLLCEAVRVGSIKLIVALLEDGADVQAADHRGHTPLHYAAAAYRISPEHRLKMIDLLLAQGAAIDPPDRQGRTPLMLAAQGVRFGYVNQNQAMPVLKLLDAGANPQATDNAGQTALDLIPESRGSEEQVQAIRDHLRKALSEVQ